MITFAAIVHKDPDSAYGLSFPDVPGCFTAGDTMEEAMVNAQEALDLHFEDEDVPEPRSFEMLRAELESVLIDGAFLAVVPYEIETGREVRVDVTLNESLLERVDSVAKRQNVSRSQFLSAAARAQLSRAARNIYG